MKTKDLIELLERNGWKFKRHGANHDIYVKGTDNEIQKTKECRVLFKVRPRRWKVYDYKC